MSHAQAEEALDGVVSQTAGAALPNPVEQFLTALRAIVAQDPARRRDFVARTRDRVRQCAGPLSEYLIAIENTLFDSEWEGDEWRWVCRRRSHVADLLALYGEAFTETERLLWFDTEQVDESIAERSAFEGPVEADDVPPEVPAAHWWWWSPGAPPTDRA